MSEDLSERDREIIRIFLDKKLRDKICERRARDIVNMYISGKMIREIAALWGLETAEVSVIISQDGTPRRRKRGPKPAALSARNCQIAEEHEGGKPVGEIAKHWGLSIQRIRQIVYQHGRPNRSDGRWPKTAPMSGAAT